MVAATPFLPCDNFLYGFQGRASGTPCTGRARGQGSRTEDAKCRRRMPKGREHNHLVQVPSGECRGLLRSRGVGFAVPLSRGGADGARRPTPVDCPRFPGYVVARRYAVSGTALSQSVRGPSNGAEESFTAQRSQSRSYVLATLRALHLDSDLPRQTHWHLSGWTGYSG